MKRLLTTLGVCLLWIATFSSVYAAEVARVIFVYGEVHVTREAESLVLKVGDKLTEGDRVTTSKDAHLHLTTVDQGFISLRPESQLYIERYEYDAKKPQQTQIKLALEYGVMRSISGEGAQAAKEQYRLNTPVSAIGVRGTDYSVLATQELTRITVSSGGVVMSEYNEHCAVSANNRCDGVDLFAQQGSAMLVLSQLQTKPQVIMNPPVQQTPDGVQQPLPQEQAKLTEQHGVDKGQAHQSDKPPRTDKEKTEGGTDKSHDATKSFSTTSLPVLTSDVIQQVKSIPPEEAGRKLYWGKWQPIADMPAESVIQQLSTLKLAGFNNIFMLKRDEGLFSLPSKGTANFNLVGSEVYMQKGNEYETSTLANIDHASLSVNFERKTFETQLSVVGEARTLPFYAKGEITDNGQMYVTRRQSNGGLIGSLSGYRADQASYLFQTNDARLQEGYTAIGITHWQR